MEEHFRAHRSRSNHFEILWLFNLQLFLQLTISHRLGECKKTMKISEHRHEIRNFKFKCNLWQRLRNVGFKTNFSKIFIFKNELKLDGDRNPKTTKNEITRRKNNSFWNMVLKLARENPEASNNNWILRYSSEMKVRTRLSFSLLCIEKFVG